MFFKLRLNLALKTALLWVVVGRCGSFWVRCGSLWIVVDGCGSFWVVLGGSSF